MSSETSTSSRPADGPRSGTQSHQLGMLMIAARVIGVVLAIATALIVTPEVFGIYGMLQALALIATAFQFLRLERAILIASGPLQAARLTRACLDLSLLTTALATFACLLIVPRLTLQAQWPLLLALFAVSVFAKGLVVLTMVWLQRFGLLREQPVILFLQPLAQFLVQVLLIATTDSPLLALLAGEILGALVAVAVVFVRDGRRSLLVMILRRHELSEQLATWRHFPLINMPAAVFSQILVSLPLLTLGHILTPERLGNFAFAMRIADAPFQLIAGTAASFVLTEGWHRVPRSGSRERNMLKRYVAAVVLFACLIAGLAWLLALMLPPGRLNSVAMLIPIAVALGASVALGAPMQDVASFRHGEVIMLLVHAGMVLAGIMVWALAPTLRSTAFSFIAIFALRSFVAILIAETGTGAGLSRAPSQAGRQDRSDPP